MSYFNITALFCEDVRMEVDKKNSLVGVMPNTLRVPDFPGVIVRLAVYVRVNFSTDVEFAKIPFRMEVPGGDVMVFDSFDEDLMNKTKSDAAKEGKNLAGMISVIQFNHISIKEAGPLRIIANINGKDQLCGILYLEKQIDQPTSA